LGDGTGEKIVEDPSSPALGRNRMHITEPRQRPMTNITMYLNKRGLLVLWRPIAFACSPLFFFTYLFLQIIARMYQKIMLLNYVHLAV
jgi:hypothetical protein